MTAKEVNDMFTSEKFPNEPVELTTPVYSMQCASESGLSGMLFTYGSGPYDQTGLYIDESEPWARVAPGQTVTLLGAKSEKVKFLWHISKAENNPSPVISAVEFAEEFKTDGAATHAKYSGRWIYLTGKVSQAERAQSDFAYAFLEGGSGKRVKLEFRFACAETFSLTAGQTASALCQYDEFKSAWDPETESLNLDAKPITGTFPVPGVTYAANK